MRKFISLFVLILVFCPVLYAGDFGIVSGAFKDGGEIPVLYTCSGKDISPSLVWTGTPQNTKTLALIVADPDAAAGVWYHWGVFNLPGSVHSLAENNLTFPSGTIVVKNSFGKDQYNGPCPPPGKSHHYIFTLYALDVQLPEATDIETLQKNMQGHVLKSATLTGLFNR